LKSRFRNKVLGETVPIFEAPDFRITHVGFKREAYAVSVLRVVALPASYAPQQGGNSQI